MASFFFKRVDHVMYAFFIFSIIVYSYKHATDSETDEK
jgi:hypothetical protein